MGDLSIFGTGGAGTIDSDQALDIWASGSLSLQDVILSAPSITLTAGTVLNVGQGVQLLGSDIHLDTPTIGTPSPREVIDWATLDIRPGTTFVDLSPAVSSVPEPTSRVLSLLGLAAGGWLLRRRQRG